MDERDLIETFPFLFHMAEAGSWASIQKHGLLSTSALLDLFEVEGEQRQRIESAHRPHSVRIAHRHHGEAMIRDQKPMSDRALKNCLTGMTPSEWYCILNQRVFFWLSEVRLSRLLGARAYRDTDHCVLTVDASTLIAAHRDAITLAPINSGSTIFKAQPRGAGTFRRIPDFPYEERRKTRRPENAVVELAVSYAVPDIVRHVTRVDLRRGSKVMRTIWQR